MEEEEEGRARAKQAPSVSATFEKKVDERFFSFFCSLSRRSLPVSPMAREDREGRTERRTVTRKRNSWEQRAAWGVVCHLMLGDRPAEREEKKKKK